MRKLLTSHEQHTKELYELKSFVLKHSHKNDREFQRLWKAIDQLSRPPDRGDSIGFNLN
jgi:hypothetical protein